jgi:hypothetical protein
MLSRFLHACYPDFYHACYYCILIFATAISLVYFRRAEKAFKWLSVLITLTCISELTAKYVGLRYGSNAIVYDIFIPIEYFVYANIYSLFLKSKKWKKILLITTAVLFFGDIINVYFFQHTTEVPTNTINIEMVMLVFLSLLLFINIREKPVYENIVTEAVFWFNSAVLFYYSFNILIWGFYGVFYNMKDPPESNSNMLLLSSGLLYALYVFSIVLNCSSVDKLSVKNV